MRWASLPLFVPAPAEFAAAAHVGDGVEEAAVEERQPRRGERRRDRGPVRAVAIQVERRGSVEGRVLAADDRDGHRDAVACRREEALAGVEPRVVAARNLAHLARHEPFLADVVVEDRVGRDHRGVVQPDLVDVVLGVRADADRVERLGKRHVPACALAVQDAHLVDPVDPLVHHDPVAEALEAAQVHAVRALDQAVPAFLLEAVLGGGRQAEVPVPVVGADDETVALVVDVVVVTLPARRHERGFGRRLVRRQEVGLAGDLVSGRDDDVASRRGLGEADPEAAVRLCVDDRVGVGRRADDVTPDLVRAPVLVHHEVEEGPVVRGPDRVAVRVLDPFVEDAAVAQVPDAHGVALAAARVGAVGGVPAVVAHGHGAEREVVVAVREGRLVEDRLDRLRVVDRPAGPGPVLCPGFKAPLVEVAAVPQRDGSVVRLLARLDLLEQYLDERLDGRHDGVEVRVLGTQVGQHVRVVDRRIVRVPQPGVRVLERHAVVREPVRSRFGDGRRQCPGLLGGFANVGRRRQRPGRQDGGQRMPHQSGSPSTRLAMMLRWISFEPL